MIKYLIPKIALADLPPMLGTAVVGALVAGIYGILHDQVTYSICPEYFTKLKFHQFHYADFGLGDRVFVSCVGFLATWWVGFIIAWFLARRLIPGQQGARAYRGIIKGFVIVFACGIAAGIAGNIYGLWFGSNYDYAIWGTILEQHEIENATAFVRVAYIHDAGYLGGLAGFIVALIVARPPKKDALHAE